MKLKQNLGNVPYLDQDVIEEYADITLKSISDSKECKINKLMLMSWNRYSNPLKEVLSNHFQNYEEDIFISCDFNSQEVKQFCDFVMKGVLPCSEADIISGKMNADVIQIFQCFGIDLKQIINPLPNKVKVEPIEQTVHVSVDLDLDNDYAGEYNEDVSEEEELDVKDVKISTNTNGTNGSTNDDYGDFDALKFHGKKGIKEMKYVGKLKCQYCPSRFSFKGTLKAHVLQVHHKPQIAQVLGGKKLGAQITRISKPMKMQLFTENLQKSPPKPIKDKPANKKDYICEICNEKLPSETTLLKHLKSDHETKPCSECDKVFEKLLELRHHKEVVHGIKTEPIKYRESRMCQDCGKVYNSPHALNFHWNKVHSPDLSIPCDSCDKVFRNQICLKEHWDKAHDKTPCTVCGNLFNKDAMKKHVLAMHSEDSKKTFICDICGRGFAYKDSYTRHMNLHKGLKPFQCDSCGKDFTDRSALGKHVKFTHQGVKRKKEAPKLCTICNKMIGSRFNDHMNIHTGEKPHKCRYCGQGFAMSGNRSAHEKSVHKGIKRAAREKS